MCLLVVQPQGASLTRKEVERYHGSNPDGFGGAYGDGNKLHLVKHVGSAKEAWQAYKAMFVGKQAILHWRWATHGSKSPANAHPFLITDGLALAHNGILSTGNDADKSKTDTECFVDLILRPMVEARGESYLFQPAILDALGEMIGRGNKFALVHKSGRTAIVNERAGIDVGKWWFSNGSFRLSSSYSSYSGYGSGARGYGDDDDLWGPRGNWHSLGTGDTRRLAGPSSGKSSGEKVTTTALTATGERVTTSGKMSKAERRRARRALRARADLSARGSIGTDAQTVRAQMVDLLKPEDFLEATDVTLWHMRTALGMGDAAAITWARTYVEAVADALVSVWDSFDPPVLRGLIADGDTTTLVKLMRAAVEEASVWLDEMHAMAIGTADSCAADVVDGVGHFDPRDLSDLRDAGLVDATTGDDGRGYGDAVEAVGA